MSHIDQKIYETDPVYAKHYTVVRMISEQLKDRSYAEPSRLIALNSKEFKTFFLDMSGCQTIYVISKIDDGHSKVRICVADFSPEEMKKQLNSIVMAYSVNSVDSEKILETEIRKEVAYIISRLLSTEEPCKKRGKIRDGVVITEEIGETGNVRVIDYSNINKASSLKAQESEREAKTIDYGAFNKFNKDKA